MNSKETGHVISHTHWDREWRYPLWQSRMQLIQLFDHLFNLFKNDKNFKAFLMDGQVIPVIDYLAMKPEYIDKMIQYVQEGRLQIGPWYTLPARRSFWRQQIFGERTNSRIPVENHL